MVGSNGVLATVLLHSLLPAVAVWRDTSSRLPKFPEAVGAGANSGSPDGNSDTRMIIIQLHPQSGPDRELPTDNPILVEFKEPPSLLEIRGADSLPVMPKAWTDAEDADATSEADLVARTKMMGQYRRQIRARIERTWMRPRPLEGGEFSCRVKIGQDRRGIVTEIELQRWKGSERWQQSLAQAVLSSSPLPAPPSPTVFVDAFFHVIRVHRHQAGRQGRGL